MLIIPAIYKDSVFVPQTEPSIPDGAKVEISIKTLHADENAKLPRKAGSLKGQIIMADDFDAPLADFKDYM